MRLHTRILTGIVAAGLITGAAACSSSSSSKTTSSSGSSSASTDSKAPLATIPTLTGQNTAVALDAGFVSALTSLGLTPGVVGTAQLTNGSLIFPITGGNVTYYKPGTVSPFVQGIIHHQGSGISLTAGSTVVQLTNFDVDPGASKLYGDVTLNGAVAATHAYLFYLDGTTLKSLQTPTPTTAVLEGTKVEISADAAPLLDKAFNTDAVKAGLLVGIAKITVNTK